MSSDHFYGLRILPVWMIASLSSNTAQGGGGSFKDRRPIGEVRCSNSWRLEHRPIYLSIYLPVEQTD